MTSFRKIAFSLLCCTVLFASPLNASTQWTKADASQAYKKEVNDPIEPINRFFFEFNDILDHLFFEPIAYLYREITPQFLRSRVHDALTNLATPVFFFNDVIQGDAVGAGNALSRFTINTTLGLAGLFDVAEDMGYKEHTNSFGKSIAVLADAGDGPYLVLPLLGSTNLRDLTGSVVDYIIDPFNITMRAKDHDGYIYVRQGIAALDDRSRAIESVANFRKTSMDFYATVRSLYKQERDYAIRGHNDIAGEPIDSPKPTDEEPY